MNKLYNVLAMLLLICFTSIHAQDVEVSGKINDENNLPMPGVNILLKGTSSGTVTDAEGNYKMLVPSASKNPILVFKYIGYAEVEKPVNTSAGANQVMTFKMALEDRGLNAVIISASKRKEKLIDAPASVTVMNVKQIETVPAITVTDNLKKVPGVDIMQTGLMAANVVARGFNGIFSGSLMTLVDNRIASVPSLKVNAYQLIPTSQSDINRIELVRGPGSALYGPNASEGVLYIETKSPLDMKEKFQTSISSSFGGSDQDASVYFVAPELRHAGRVKDWFGYKISGGYLKGSDWQYYDSREPKVGDLMWFGTAKNGQVFTPDTAGRFDRDGDGNIDSVYIRSQNFDRDFGIKKYNFDARMDFKLPKKVFITVNGGMSNGSNIELTGLGAGQALHWKSYYGQIRLKWKNLFVQYYLNGTNSGDTYLIPQVGSTAQPPHKIQSLLDKSKMHVFQIQHSVRPVQRLNLIYGADVLLTRPQTDGTINGRFENMDNINQYGAYIQGDLDFAKKLKLVTAFRLDYHDKMKELMFSPRAALVYKVNQNNTLRMTYNRAFSSPSTLNLYLDLSNGLIPNGINVRGLGNAKGLDYHYDANGNAQMRSPYFSGWYDINDKTNNYVAFDNMTSIIANGLGAKTGLPGTVIQSFLDAIFDGISTDTGSIQDVNHKAIDYITKEEWTGGYSKVEKIKSTITQTYELGYKGFIGNKLSITADIYHTRIKNFVSPLTISSSSVIFDAKELTSALGAQNASGLLYNNLQKPSSIFPGLTIDQSLLLFNDPVTLAPLLDGAYTGGTPNGTNWDDLVNLILGANKAIPIGSVTPDDSLVGNDVILVYRNLGKVDVTGIDIGANYEIIDGFSVSFAGSFVNKDRIALKGASNGYVALNAPRFKTSVGIDHEIKKIGFGYGLNWRWTDAFPANSAIYVGTVNAANMLDLRFSYRPHTEDKWLKGILLSFNINNLLGYRFQGFPGTPAMGRMFIGKLSYSF